MEERGCRGTTFPQRQQLYVAKKGYSILTHGVFELTGASFRCVSPYVEKCSSDAKKKAFAYTYVNE